jgi:hypothetical protein
MKVPRGFRFGGVHCALKPQRRDLALVVSDHPASAAGVFTRNLAAAAPVQDARTRVDDELGDTGVDWEALDPRRYDPRRIVRQALLDDPPAARDVPKNRPVAPRPATMPAARSGAWDGPTPYDNEAT